MRFMMKELNRFEDETTSRMSCCATASSISSSHIHRDRRHPRRRLAYVAAVALMGLAAGTGLLHLPHPSHPPWLLCRRVPCSPVRRCLCCAARRSSAAGPPRRLRCRCIAVGSSFLSTVIWGCHRCSLSLPGSAPICRVGPPPPRPPPPPLSAELHAAILALSQEPGACV